MNNIRFFLDNLWRWSSGISEIEIDKTNIYNSVPDIDKIKQLQYSKKFTKLMNNRMIMGFFRYGKKKTRNANYDYIASAKRRILLYEQIGNLEYLVDAANMLRMEFDTPQNSKAYFKSIDDKEHEKQSKRI